MTVTYDTPPLKVLTHGESKQVNISTMVHYTAVTTGRSSGRCFDVHLWQRDSVRRQHDEGYIQCPS